VSNTDNIVGWKRVGRFILAACFAITCSTLFWYVKILVTGNFLEQPGFTLMITVLLVTEYLLFLDEYSNPIYVVAAINLWPLVLVTGWGTAFALFVHVTSGATEWLEKGQSVSRRFTEYLEAVRINLSENTSYLGWNKIARSINETSLISGEILIIFTCFVSFFLFFLVTEWGRRKAS
jgi:hypothetical protein